MRKGRQLLVEALSLILGLLAISQPVQGQGVELVAGAVAIGGSLAVKKLLADAEQRINNVLADADARTRLIVSAGSEAALLLLEQTKQNLKDVLDSTFQQLNESRKAMIIDLFATIFKLERSVKDATITASIELTKWGQTNLFWAESLPFVIKSIDPFVIIKQPAATTYPVRIRGLGFGVDEGKRKFAMKFMLVGTDIDPANFDRQPDGVTVNIPSSIISNYFASSRPTKVPTTFVSTITAEKRCWLFSTCSDTSMHSSTFNLTVYPEKAGRFMLEQTAIEPELGEFLNPPRRDTVTTASGHPNGTHRMTRSGPHTAEPGYVFVYPDNSPEGFKKRCGSPIDNEACKFFHSFNCNITSHGKQVMCTSVTSSHSVTIDYEFPQRKELQRPVTIPEMPLDWAFGETKKISYRADATSARLHGTLASGEDVHVSIVPSTAPTSEWLSCFGAADIGGGKKQVDCHLRAPQ